MAYFRTGGQGATGNAAVGDVLSGKTFSNENDIDLEGTMTNNGAVDVTIDTNTTQYTVPAGYHNGSGKVKVTTQEKSVTPTTASQNVTPDSGKVLSKVTVGTQKHSGTYSATSRGASLDMGEVHNQRYVNTNSVPNSNSGTYTFAENDTGGTKDMGATNSYRYVNAQNVYNKGKADGTPSTLDIILANGQGMLPAYLLNQYSNIKLVTSANYTNAYGSFTTNAITYYANNNGNQIYTSTGQLGATAISIQSLALTSNLQLYWNDTGARCIRLTK